MARCVIIGANGFIGSHLVDALVESGHEVTAFDRFSAGAATFRSDDVRVVVGDFANRADLASAVRGQEVVFHLLSATTPITSEGDPSLDLRSNVGQTVDLLELCVEAGVSRFFFASTGGAMYSAPSDRPILETDLPTPVSPYAIGKLAIENYLRYFHVTHGLQSVAFRISNPYGTRQHPLRRQGLIPIAARQIAGSEPVVRYGDGRMVRDYIYVDDLVAMMLKVLNGSPKWGLYHLGSGTGLTVNEVLDCLSTVAGARFEIEERPVPATFVDHVVLDTGRFTSEFGQVPMTPLEMGVQAVLDEAFAASRTVLDPTARAL
ncbi:NAD-dependent epimerase/dehydratase family protein [Leifsonia sp. NPDC077715]|uniref:NAD-dependent epimerase/dehydratase family protein n=1 Tax=Leifsonia sp. NPDC077715 TaxID=3155539 RepID=UPI003440FF45